MRRFYLISQPRSGGTAVQRMLDAAPGQLCEGESGLWLERLRAAEKEREGVSGSWRRGSQGGHLCRERDAILSYGVRSSYFGGRGWEDAVGAWSWLLKDPAACIVFTLRGEDAEGRAELSLEGTSPLWQPAFGKCRGEVLRRWRGMRQSMLDFHEMNPGRTALLRMEDLGDFAGLQRSLAPLGLGISETAWRHAMEERPGNLRESLDELLEKGESLPVQGDDHGDEPAARSDDADPFASEASTEPGEESTSPDDIDPFADSAPRETPHWKAKPGRMPRPVVELHLPRERPLLSVSIMAHPSRAGWVAELQKFFAGCPVAMDDDGRGMIANGAAAWRLHHPAADYHLVIQDDAEPCADFINEARRYLAGLKQPAAVSFYHSGKKKFRARALKARRQGGLRGRLRWGPAIALPVAWIPEMLAFYETQARPQYDARIGDWLSSRKRLCHYPLPSLVDHRGAHSLIGNNHRGKRRAATVRKIEADGATLREVREIPSVPRAIVYPWLSRGAVWEELRYSLRSVEKYCEDRTCPIYILGDQAPPWLAKESGRLRFIALDGYTRHPKSRAHAVFQAKAIGMQLAEEVLWMNDDFYALKPFRFEDFRTALHAGEITAEVPAMLGNRGSGWVRNIGAAAADLMAKGVKRVWKFSTHTPQLYERAKALEILRHFHVAFSGGFENLYHNWHGTPRRAVGSQRVSSLPAKAGARFLNHPATGPNERTGAELRRIFAEPAPWEIPIPRRIHQTWKNTEIPHDVYPREWIESWQAHHPDWSYKLWTDADLLQLAREHYPEFTELMERARGVVKADVGRLLMLHHEGGLYADLDYLCLRPMERLLDGGAVWVCTMEGDYTHNALLAAIPGHPMLLAAAREALERWQRSPQSAPEWISGPSLLEDFAAKWHPSRWTAAEVCPLDWRNKEHLGEWRALLDQCADAHAVTFWRHNW